MRKRNDSANLSEPWPLQMFFLSIGVFIGAGERVVGKFTLGGLGTTCGSRKLEVAY